MAIHPLHILGFEPILRQPETRHRSLAELGFETSTVAINPQPAPAANPSPANQALPREELNSTAEQRSTHKAAGTIVKGTVVKGARVRLADGALAKVLYVDPNMRIARVRTEDGRNLTVRRRDLG